MKELLIAIRKAFEVDLLDESGSVTLDEAGTSIQQNPDSPMAAVRDIFIAIDEQVLPAGTKLPAIGIKDGQVATGKRGCGVKEKTMRVTVICWAPGGKDSDQVMGDATQPGVLTMAQGIEDLLDDNLLGIDGMQSADIVADTGSAMFINQQNKSIQQKTITFEYVRER